MKTFKGKTGKKANFKKKKKDARKALKNLNKII